MITESEYNQLTQYIELLETVVKNQSAVDLPIEFLDTVKTICRTYNYLGCMNCQRDLYLCVCRLYDRYLEYKNNLNSNAKVVKRKNTKISK